MPDLETYLRFERAIDDIAKVNPDLGELLRSLLQDVESLKTCVAQLEERSP